MDHGILESILANIWFSAGAGNLLRLGPVRGQKGILRCYGCFQNLGVLVLVVLMIWPVVS